MIEALSKLLDCTLWKIKADNQLELVSRGKSYENLDHLKNLNLLNPYVDLSEDAFNFWMKSLHNPPFSLSDIVALVPKNITIENHNYQIHIDSIEIGSEKSLFLALQDVSSISKSEQKVEESAETQQLKIVKKISSNRIYFSSFLEEIQFLISDLRDFLVSPSGDKALEVLFNRIHTIKGASSIFDVVSLESACFKMEQIYSIFKKENLEFQDIQDDLVASIQDFLDTYEKFLQFLNESFGLGAQSSNTLNINLQEFNNFIAKIDDESVRSQFQEHFIKKSIIECLSPYNSVLQNVAGDLGKQVNNIIFSKGCLYKVDPQYFYYVTNGIVHILKNAVTHGIELPEVRLGKGKSEAGNIYVDTKVTDDIFQLTFKDDGIGVAPQSLNQEDSEPDELKKHSGLGVGLISLEESLARFGGTFEVKSEVDNGREVILTLPLKDRIDLFINHQKDYKADLFSNFRRMSENFNPENIILGHQENIIKIMKEIAERKIRFYVDIEEPSCIETLIELDQLDLADSSEESYLNILHQNANRSLDHEIPCDQELDHVLDLVQQECEQQKGAKRCFTSLRFIIDELFTNARTVSENTEKNSLRIFLSLTDDNARLSFCDLSGTLDIQQLRLSLAKIYQQGIVNSIKQGKGSNAGIGLALILSKVSKFGVVCKSKHYTIISIELPYAKKNMKGLTGLYYIG